MKFTKFNLNNYVYVEITEEGWQYLYKNLEISSIIAIKAGESLLNGSRYYKMQAYEMMRLFGSVMTVGSPQPLPISLNVLLDDN